jgi:toxin ParE1/3/4
MNLVFSSVFEQDFAELVAHFAANASGEVAARFEDNTCKLIERLLRQPEMGRLRKDLKPQGVRSFRIHGFDRYLLFYRIKGDDLVLLRLRYGGMDLPAAFMGWN